MSARKKSAAKIKKTGSRVFCKGMHFENTMVKLRLQSKKKPRKLGKSLQGYDCGVRKTCHVSYDTETAEGETGTGQGAEKLGQIHSYWKRPQATC